MHRGRGRLVDRTRRRLPGDHAPALYDKLAQIVLPLYYEQAGALAVDDEEGDRTDCILFQQPTHDAPLRGRGLSALIRCRHRMRVR